MNYRSKRLLDAARDAPKCFCCARPNNGTIVAAHSNQLRDGKGRGIKANDYRIAYVCFECHQRIDEGNDSREIKQALWETAHRASIGWLFDSGKVVAK